MLACNRHASWEMSGLDAALMVRHANSMTLIGLLVLLLIASVCGSIGSSLAGYSHSGCVGSIVLGFIGAWLGRWIAAEAHLPTLYVLHVGGESFPVVWSIVGAALFAAVMSFLTGRSRYGF